MNPLKFRFLLILIISFAVTAWAEEAKVEVIRDFTTNSFDYGYEGWEGLNEILTTSKTGVAINAPAKGGAGVFFQDIVDIIDSNKIAIKLKRLPGNTCDKLFLKMVSATGETAFETEIKLSEVDEGEFTTLSFALPKKGDPNYTKLEEIKHLQIQGSFTPGQKLAVEIENITAITSPVSTVAK